MSPCLNHSDAVHMLTGIMDRRGLEFDVRSQRNLGRYTTEKLIALAQILTMEGKYNFIGECEVSGLRARSSEEAVK